MSRIPDGLAEALCGIADRLDKSAERGRESAEESLAALPPGSRGHLVDTFIARWLKEDTAQAAREIRIAIEVWSKPLRRARRGGRR